MTYYHQVSGGTGSWLAAKVAMARYPDAEHRFVFADTLYEDADCYRFLVEGIAALLGRKVRVPVVSDFPDYRVRGEFRIEDYRGNPEWRAHLAAIRAQALDDLPELIWLVEGRDPWEVFRDRRFLGNSRADPCSDILKRQVIEAWREVMCNRETDICTVGIGMHERHRFEGGRGKRGLRARMDEKGWTFLAPLLDTREGEFHWVGAGVVFLDKAGIARPRLYRRGYVHNNCGGFCIKAGHEHYRNRLEQDAERFAYDEMMEGKIAEYVGQAVAMMTDRRNGEKVPMSLARFRQEYEARPDESFNMFEGDSGCGCAIDYDD